LSGGCWKIAEFFSAVNVFPIENTLQTNEWNSLWFRFSKRDVLEAAIKSPGSVLVATDFPHRLDYAAA
jgi:hypothetical protein